MPVHVLSDAECERLAQFPSSISPDDLHAYFTLGETDHTFIQTHRGATNRLGVALQIGMLRYLGYWPDDVTHLPQAVVAYVAQQPDAPVARLAAYGQRAHRRTDHQQQIERYLGFRSADMFDLATMTAWLVERALEHDRPRLLVHLALEKLLQERLIRPGISVVERLVATARKRAQAETFQRLDPLLTPTLQTTLDLLLVPDPQTGRTPLAWVRQGATANTARAILEQLEKLHYMRQWDIDTWPLDRLTPNRLKFLAQLGQKATNQALQRMTADRRYPILIAFLWQMRELLTDEIVELFDRCLAHAHSRAARDLDAFRRTAARATNEKVRLFHDLARIVLDPAVADEAVRTAIYAEVPPLHLMAAVEEAVKLLRPLDDNYFDFVVQRYSYVRTFTPTLLAAFAFRSHQRNDPLLQAVALLTQLNQARRRKVPDDAPLAFVPPKWQPYVLEANGQIDRRYYELCVLWELRHALRAGDVWLLGSRRYADPETYLISHDRWPVLRAEACALMHVPEQGIERLAQRQQELEARLTALDQRLRHSSAVRIEQGDLVVTPLAADERPDSSVRLDQEMSAALPWIELTDLLIEVDRFTNFSQYFEHAGGREPRSQQFLRHLYAAIVAQACNFGLEEMAQIADLSYQRLAWCTTWYVREETLRAATTALVNAQYHQPLGQLWGGGTLSSSDGQRFPVAMQARNVTALPRYFGYGRGLTFYTWTSDQFSQYGAKVIPATVRDATYVLDELLDNETELPLLEHTTDTSGYTEMVFALFDLLGFQFAPRIRDLGDQRLYRIDRTVQYRRLEPLLKGTLNCSIFLQRWDDLLRVAASLKLGYVTASLFIGKLQWYPRQNALTRALQEYNRLIKTLFILQYLESEDYRRRIHGQLNKVEALHALRRFLFFAHEGKIRRQQESDQTNQAGCLNLVTNAVIFWNTVYMHAVLDQMRAEGHTVAPADVLHLSPARYDHINPYGTYRFNVDEELERTTLRPPRQPERSNP